MEAKMLKGTDKQIQWAEEIRAKMLLQGADVEQLAAKWEAKQPAQAAAVRKALVQITEQEDASWWIDRRDSNLRTLVVTIAKSLM